MEEEHMQNIHLPLTMASDYNRSKYLAPNCIVIWGIISVRSVDDRVLRKDLMCQSHCQYILKSMSFCRKNFTRCRGGTKPLVIVNNIFPDHTLRMVVWWILTIFSSIHLKNSFCMYWKIKKIKILWFYLTTLKILNRKCQFL